MAPPERPKIASAGAKPAAAPHEGQPGRPGPQEQQPNQLGSALAAAVKQTAVSALVDKRPYLKYAFSNPYNLSLLGGALAAAGLTLNPALAIAALGLEAIWLLHAPDSKRLRHLLWDPRFEK